MMASCQLYPFTETNATFFSQELIQYVLEEFGHIWKPQRSKTENELREHAMFSFTPDIGKTVAFLSRKHGRFVVETCYKSWGYIKSHRVSVLKYLLYNDITYLCSKCELGDDDFGLFIFMAIVVEYARFAIVDRQTHLIEEVVKALSHCMTNLIPGGCIGTIERMEYRASTFNLSELSMDMDDSKRSCTILLSTDNEQTPESRYRTPLNYDIEFSVGSTQFSTPMEEEIDVQCQQRELQRRLFKYTNEAKRYLETSDNIASVVENQESEASYSDIPTQENSKYDHNQETSSTEKIDESNAEALSTDEESSILSNYEKFVTKAAYSSNFTSDKVQTEPLEISVKAVTSTNLHCPIKNVDISETSENNKFSEDNKQFSSGAVVGSGKDNGEQNSDRTIDDSSAENEVPLLPKLPPIETLLK